MAALVMAALVTVALSSRLPSLVTAALLVTVAPIVTAALIVCLTSINAVCSLNRESVAAALKAIFVGFINTSRQGRYCKLGMRIGHLVCLPSGVLVAVALVTLALVTLTLVMLALVTAALILGDGSLLNLLESCCFDHLLLLFQIMSQLL